MSHAEALPAAGCAVAHEECPLQYRTATAEEACSVATPPHCTGTVDPDVVTEDCQDDEQSPFGACAGDTQSETSTQARVVPPEVECISSRQCLTRKRCRGDKEPVKKRLRRTDAEHEYFGMSTARALFDQLDFSVVMTSDQFQL
jgi:hypothetical protein